MTQITLLHTAEAHVATFDALRDRITPGAVLHHVVRPDWLATARASGPTEALIKEITEAIQSAQGTALCTCTTIGDMAETAGALVIDRPAMTEAARIGGPILMAYALESTAAPSRAALERALARADKTADVIPLPLPQFWPLFESDERDAFAACIAGAIRDALPTAKPACILLAQASMAPAAALLSDLDTPVLTTPETALRAALAR
ncbi:hypothetical protein [Shimia aestuarii]|uniref:hypothetical protein n=1 Tax=Shimia aestuarii TaxID=254406 RepID=UPI001FB3E115|nr:hypothetical protein [Shimia aestuarii]